MNILKLSIIINKKNNEKTVKENENNKSKQIQKKKTNEK